jgi:subtilisin family serine protease
MRSWASTFAIFAALAILAPAALPRPVSAIEPGHGSRPNPGRLLVFTNGDPGARAAIQREAQRQGGRTAGEVRVRPDLSFVVVEAPGAASDFAGIPGVREVAPDVPPVPMAETTDWGVKRIGAESAWTATTGTGIAVAVVDGGVDLTHEDLANNTAGNPHANCGDTTCTPGGSDPDNDGHGTGVAGIIAAVRGNNTGTVGVSPGAKILSVNCMEPGTFFSCLNGVYYAAGLDQNGVKVTNPRARVINMSWGWADRDLNRCASCKTVIGTVMQNAAAAGVVLVASAGNAGNTGGSTDSVTWPARTGFPIAVAATDSNNRRASWSSTGSEVDLSAPGVNIQSTFHNGAYTTWSGTSAASPHVAGAAALVLSANTGLNKDQVRAYLLNTACTLGSQTQYGKGLVRVDRALASAKNLSLPAC